MRHKIELTLNEFCNYSNLCLEYDLSKNMAGTCIVESKEYLIIWRSEIRKSGAERLLNLHSGQQVIIISNKIYGSARSLFLENKMNHLEYQGNFYFEQGNILRIRRKNNNYDKRRNYTRLYGNYGSRFIIALLLEPNLLNSSVLQIASSLNMGESTVYYYLNGFKREGFIVKNKDSHGYSSGMKQFNIQALINNFFIRGHNTMVIDHLYKVLTSKINFAFKNFGISAKPTSGFLFYDTISKYKRTLYNLIREQSRDQIVLISPFNKNIAPKLDLEFKKQFSDWYTSERI